MIMAVGKPALFDLTHFLCAVLAFCLRRRCTEPQLFVDIVHDDTT
jgi:hypothetical protein